MHSMQLPAREPAFNRTSSEAQGDQLPPRHDSVLAACELRDLPIRGTLRPFSMHDMGFGRRIEHAADGEAAQRACGAPKMTGLKQMKLQPAGTASGFDPLK
jgi:hypothetical protein